MIYAKGNTLQYQSNIIYIPVDFVLEVVDVVLPFLSEMVLGGDHSPASCKAVGSQLSRLG